MFLAASIILLFAGCMECWYATGFSYMDREEINYTIWGWISAAVTNNTERSVFKFLHIKFIADMVIHCCPDCICGRACVKIEYKHFEFKS